MAFIGFIALLVLGAFLFCGGIIGAWIHYAFSGRVEWASLILLCGSGGAFLYVAVMHAPFSIIWSQS